MTTSKHGPFTLKAGDRQQLRQIARSKLETAQRAVRALMLLNLSRGDLVHDVAIAHETTERTVLNLRLRYEAEGLAALDDRPKPPHQGKLSAAQKAALKRHFKRHPPATAKAAADHIRKTCGIDYSVSGATRLLGRLRMVWQRPKRLPLAADAAEQRRHIAMYKTLKRNKSTREAIFFVDAVHPEHQSRPAHAWFAKGSRPAIAAASGRGRINLVGALNVETGELVIVEAKRVNGTTMTTLLTQLQAQCGDRYDRVHVIMDNAGYNRAALVQAHAAQSNDWLELHYLPPYAPHLNPIERLWGVLHKHVTHNRWYATLKEFRERLLQFLLEEVPQQWESMKSRVTDNFREITHEGHEIHNLA